MIRNSNSYNKYMEQLKKIEQFKLNEKAKVSSLNLLGVNKKYATVGEKRLPE